MRYRILPYKQGSRSARALSEELGGKVLRLQNSRYQRRDGDVIINWGSSTWGPLSSLSCPEGAEFYVYNTPAKVLVASNKLSFFDAMEDYGLSDIVPEYWTDSEDIPDEAFPIVCRTTLTGHSGAGIVIATDRSGLVHAPLYTRYVKKKDEYRIHVGMRYFAEDNEEKVYESVVISVQRKAKRHDAEEVNWQIRNHQNGFVFVREGVNPPPSVLSAATQALEASGLDFGAVDVVYNENQDRAYVLEINTAPGLEGQTVKDYASFFRSL